MSIDTFTMFMIGMSVIFPFLMLIYLWRFSHSTDNRIFFIERYYEINENEIIGKLKDGSSTPIKFEYIIKIYETKDYSLIYISKAQFLYLPKNAFEVENDYKEFINHLREQIKLNKKKHAA